MEMQKTCRFRRTCKSSPDALTLLPYHCVLDTQFPLYQEEGFNNNLRALPVFCVVKCLYRYFCFIGWLSLVYKSSHIEDIGYLYSLDKKLF